jgi:hypothetical protein
MCVALERNNIQISAQTYQVVQNYFHCGGYLVVFSKYNNKIDLKPLIVLWLLINIDTNLIFCWPCIVI